MQGGRPVLTKGCRDQVWFDATWSDLGLAVSGTFGDCVEDRGLILTGVSERFSEQETSHHTDEGEKPAE